MKNFFSYKYKIFAFIILLSFLKVIISDKSEVIDLDGIDAAASPHNFSLDEDMCVKFLVKLNDEQKKNENLYVRISVDSNDVEDMNRQQLYYSTESCPTSSDAEQYSLRASKHPNIFAKYNNKIDLIYLRVKCFNYPCKISLYAGIEKDYLFSTSASIDDKETYSYYSYGDKINTMNFKIPSSLDKKYPTNAKHALTISVTNPSDTDYIQLYSMVNGAKNKIEVDKYQIPIGIIFTFIEEDYIDPNKCKDAKCFYVLEIQSLENQFVSFSAKTSIYVENTLETTIMPNSQSYYSYLNTKNILATEECFKIDEEYEKKNLFKNDEDLVFASVHYYTLPIRPYLKYNNEYKLIEEWDSSKNSINIILKKESNIRRQICFKKEDRTPSAFSLEISYVSKNNKNIDIYSPLTSGFTHMKSLKKNTLAFYTHNSDVHFNEKLSFFLNPLKGKPEMYIMSCDDYPFCPNEISQLRSDSNVQKATLRDNGIYSYSSNTKHEKDLSPYGPKQKLLYVYCPDDTTEEYCQFEILINSNVDQITLSNTKSFYSHLLKDESDLFQILLKKNSPDFEKIQVSIKSEQNVELVYISDNMESQYQIIKQGELYEFTPSKNYSIFDKDYELLFNVIAKDESDYSIEYRTIKKRTKELTFGKIEDIKINIYPFDFCYKLPNKKLDFKDLLFNLNLKSLSLDRATGKTSSFNTISMNATIINVLQLENLQSADNVDTSIFNEKSLLFNKEVDLSTKSISLDINKEYANKLSNNNDEELVLYFTIENNNKDNPYMEGQLFLFYENDKDFIIPYNNYINSKLSTNNENFKYYHLQLGENKKQFVVDFSSNYELGNNLKISFIDYDTDIENQKPENIIKNSTNVNFTKSTNKNRAINQFEFTLNNNKNDIFLCVYSNVKNNNLTSVNYVFKYNTYVSEDKNRVKYEINKKIQHSKTSDNKYLIFEFDNIKKMKDNNNKDEYCKGEIYVKKIEKNNKIDIEKIDSLALIETKYQLLKGKVKYDNNAAKVKVEMDYNNRTENNYYSVFVDLPEENEKFSYDMIYLSESKETKETANTILKRYFWWILGGSVLIVLIIIILIIIVVTKKKNDELGDNINSVSFKADGENAIIDDIERENSEILE